MADGFQGLGADAIISCHHQNSHVGHLGAAGSHGRERFVARSVQEGELALFVVVLDLNLIRTDVLRDAAGLTRSDAGLTDGIQKAGFAVVDVAHDGDHGRTPDQVSLVGLFDHFDGLLGRLLHVVLQHRHTKFVGDGLDCWHVQGLGDRGDDPFEEKGFDDL